MYMQMQGAGRYDGRSLVSSLQISSVSSVK